MHYQLNRRKKNNFVFPPEKMGEREVVSNDCDVFYIEMGEIVFS